MIVWLLGNGLRWRCDINNLRGSRSCVRVIEGGFAATVAVAARNWRRRNRKGVGLLREGFGRRRVVRKERLVDDVTRFGFRSFEFLFFRELLISFFLELLLLLLRVQLLQLLRDQFFLLLRFLFLLVLEVIFQFLRFSVTQREVFLEFSRLFMRFSFISIFLAGLRSKQLIQGRGFRC